MSDWPSYKIDSEGVSLSYSRTGNGDRPRLVLCHGFGDNGGCWARTAHALASDYDVLMPDARNHGLSGEGPAAVTNLAADVSAVISSEGAKTAIVMGHSVGAISAAAFAADYPNQISGLILEDPPWTNTGPVVASEREKRAAQFKAYIEKLKSLSDSELQSFGKKTHPGWHADEFAAWAEGKRQVSNDAMARLDLGDWRNLVEQIVCPTLLLYGDQDNGCDGIVSSALAQEIATINPNVQPLHVPGAGHNLRREQFEAFIDSVNEFLNRISR